MKAKTALSAVLVTASVVGAFGSDWPNYQGPKRDGTSTQKGVLRSWAKDGPKVWTVPLTGGYMAGTAMLVDGKLLIRDQKQMKCLQVAQ